MKTELHLLKESKILTFNLKKWVLKEAKELSKMEVKIIFYQHLKETPLNWHTTKKKDRLI